MLTATSVLTSEWKALTLRGRVHIRQLEDALQISHASVSTTPHPLLSEEQLSIKYGSDAQEEAEKNNSSSDWDIYTSFGTLTISERGETRFVGRSSSEVSHSLIA